MAQTDNNFQAIGHVQKKEKGGTGQTQWGQSLTQLVSGGYGGTQDFGALFQMNFGSKGPRNNQTYNGVTQVLDTDTKCVLISEWGDTPPPQLIMVNGAGGVGTLGQLVLISWHYTGVNNYMTLANSNSAGGSAVQYAQKGGALYLRQVQNGSVFVNPIKFNISCISTTSINASVSRIRVIDTPADLLPGGANENLWITCGAYTGSWQPLTASIAGSTDDRTFPSQKQVVDLVSSVTPSSVTKTNITSVSTSNITLGNYNSWWKQSGSMVEIMCLFSTTADVTFSALNQVTFSIPGLPAPSEEINFPVIPYQIAYGDFSPYLQAFISGGGSIKLKNGFKDADLSLKSGDFFVVHGFYYV